MSDILIIEDESDIRESLKEILELEEFVISTAINGKDALEKLRELPNPKLILLDLLMPVMNGIEFREKQVQQEKIAKIPVVLMSADNYTKKKAEDMQLDYLKKPIELDKLLHLIGRYCV